MENITFEYLKCDDILDKFGKEKVEKRFNTLYAEMDEFIKDNKLDSVAEVNKILLGEVMIDYFTDIMRLKDFSKIERVNSQKKIAYTAYWIIRRKPIQIIVPQTEDPLYSNSLSAINEKFVMQYITTYFSKRERGEHILLRSEKCEGLKNFSAMLFYYLVYRLRDAQSLEMIITAFFAGQIYERTDVDISSELHSYDH